MERYVSTILKWKNGRAEYAFWFLISSMTASSPPPQNQTLFQHHLTSSSSLQILSLRLAMDHIE
jgi:hypothetical protein